MPIFNLHCKSCDHKQKRLFKERPPEVPKCEKCGGDQEYVSNMHTIVMETFDNGFMPKKVHRLRDIEQLKHERSKDFELKATEKDDIV